MDEINLDNVSTEDLIQEIEKRLVSPFFSLKVKSKFDRSTHPQFSEFKGALLACESTYSILKQNDSPAGLMIKDIVKIYLDAGIRTHDRCIDAHIKKLLAEEKIFQINPPYLRGKRFRSVQL